MMLRCENVNNETFILHPGLSINREIRVFPRAVGNTGKYREIGNPCPHNFIKHCYLYLTLLELFAAVIMYLPFLDRDSQLLGLITSTRLIMS